jgi:sterol desaturase/sphingolipid hydroxylase (fatty acid hydroxylase superfamily)
LKPDDDNIKLPFLLEMALNILIVTPGMQGIHHSMIERETDYNYSIVFSFWDRIHKTVRLNINKNKIITGVPSYADEKEVTIKNLLKMAFTKIRKWNNTERIEKGKYNQLKA